MSGQDHGTPELSWDGVTPAEQRVLDRLGERLEHHGVLPAEYGILEPKPDALVLERSPAGGWQLRYWDANRGPGDHPRRPFPHAVDAAKALLAELLWHSHLDDARAHHRTNTATGDGPHERG